MWLCSINFEFSDDIFIMYIVLIVTHSEQAKVINSGLWILNALLLCVYCLRHDITLNNLPMLVQVLPSPQSSRKVIKEIQIRDKLALRKQSLSLAPCSLGLKKNIIKGEMLKIYKDLWSISQISCQCYRNVVKGAQFPTQQGLSLAFLFLATISSRRTTLLNCDIYPISIPKHMWFCL